MIVFGSGQIFSYIFYWLATLGGNCFDVGFTALRHVSEKNYGAARTVSSGQLPADCIASLLDGMGTKAAIETLKLPTLSLEVFYFWSFQICSALYMLRSCLLSAAFWWLCVAIKFSSLHNYRCG